MALLQKRNEEVYKLERTFVHLRLMASCVYVHVHLPELQISTSTWNRLEMFIVILETILD